MLAAFASSSPASETSFEQNFTLNDNKLGVGGLIVQLTQDELSPNKSTDSAVNLNFSNYNSTLDGVKYIYGVGLLPLVTNDGSAFASQASLTINTPESDFSILINPVDDGKNAAIRGIAVGTASDGGNDYPQSATATLTLKAQDVNIDVGCETCSNVRAISLSATPAKPQNTQNINIEAAGDVKLKATGDGNYGTVYAIETNAEGKVAIQGASIEIETINKQNALYLDWNGSVNSYYGGIDLKSTDSLSKGITITTTSSGGFAAGLDLQNHAWWADASTNPTSAHIESASDVSIFTDQSTAASGAVAGIIARHYSWVNGDLDEEALIDLDLYAAGDLSIESKAAAVSIKASGVIIDSDLKNLDASPLVQKFSAGQDVRISVESRRIGVVGGYVNFWGESGTSAVDLNNGALQITAGHDVSLKAETQSSAITRGFSADLKTEGAQSSGGRYEDDQGREYTTIIKGDQTSTITAGQTVCIEASANTGKQIQGLYWGSAGKNDITAKNGDIVLNATAGNGQWVVGGEFENGVNTLTAENGTLSAKASLTPDSYSGDAREATTTLHGLRASGDMTTVAVNALNIELVSSTEGNLPDGTVVSGSGVVANSKALIEGTVGTGGLLNLSGVSTAGLALNGGKVTLDASNGRALVTGNTLAVGEDSAFTLSYASSSNAFNVYALEGGVNTLELSKNAAFTGVVDNFRNGGTLDELDAIKASASLAPQETPPATTDKEAETHVSLDASVWNVTGDSSVTTLTMNDAQLNLAYKPESTAARIAYKNLNVQKLAMGSGDSGGSILFAVDLADEANGALDTIDADTVSGTYTGHVIFDNPQDIEGKFFTQSAFIHQAGGSMTVNTPNGELISGDGMLSQWTWKFLPNNSTVDKNDSQALWNDLTNASADEEGDWILVRAPETDPDEPLPGEVTDNVTIGTSTAQALAYLADLEDLRKRIGEVRYGAQAGVWAKAFTKQDRVEGSKTRGFKQEAYGINLGADSLVTASESSAWLLGAAFRYSNADQEGLAAAGHASGELDEYSVKAYATWMHESGSYADMVLQAGRYEQELKGLANSGTGLTSADYGTWGFGASVEVGHMFTFGDNVDDRRWFNHWFIEPQFELSYFYAKGQNYGTSTGLTVDQDDADFLTGRAGVVIGKKFNYGNVDSLDRRYFQIAVIGGVKHEFLGGDQTIRYRGTDGVRKQVRADDLAGTRFYYGLNCDWQLDDNWRLFAQLDREEGDGYTEDYDFSVGFKYAF